MRQVNVYTKGYSYFMCGTYGRAIAKYEKKCTRHTIRKNDIEEIVLAKIKETLGDVLIDKVAFAARIHKTSNVENERTIKTKKTELAKAERRITDLDRIIKNIYEDNLNGKLNDVRFGKMLADYENKQEILTVTATTLKVEIDELTAKTANVESFIKLVEQFGEIDTLAYLTADLARTFIKRIDVHEATRGTKRDCTQKTISQQVDIYFNHIGQYDASEE